MSVEKGDIQRLDEAVLGVTSGDDWQGFLTVMNAEFTAATQNELDAEDMETIKYWRGYRAALSFVANMRETTKALMEQANADV
jgi:hypothetical protein